MGAVELPALDGRDPLGFLAALGTLRLLSERDSSVRLSFSPVTGIAILHGPFGDVDAIATVLQNIVECIDVGSVIPEAPANFPLPKQGIKGGDPMRQRRENFRRYVQGLVPSHVHAMWLPSLITDLAIDNEDRTTISLLMAPSGKMNVRTFFGKSFEIVRSHPGTIREAIVGWRRRDNFSGEYLDHRVINNAADHPSGDSTEAGVPGATWLAIMALPIFRVTGTVTGNVVETTAWHRPPRRRTPIMIWPLWRDPLSVEAVRVLLEHSALQPSVGEKDTTVVDTKELAQLGIFQVVAAERQSIEGRKFAGVLSPARVLVRRQ